MAARRLAAAIAATVLALAGCGQSSTPAEDVPALSRALDRVDTAIADEKYAEADRALTELIRVAERAESAGDLDADRADEIVTAAEVLQGALPDSEPKTPPPTETTSSSPTPEPEEDDEEDEGEEHGQKPDEGKGKGHDKEDKPKDD